MLLPCFEDAFGNIHSMRVFLKAEQDLVFELARFVSTV